MKDEILKAVNFIKAKNGAPHLTKFEDSLRLGEDLGFDSLAMAELTVRLEAISGVDIFENGVVKTLGEVKERLEGGVQSRE